MADNKRQKTGNQLEKLSEVTTIVADTGDIESIRKFSPQVHIQLRLRFASCAFLHLLLNDGALIMLPSLTGLRRMPQPTHR